MLQSIHTSKENEPAEKKPELLSKVSTVSEPLSHFEHLPRHLGNQAMQSRVSYSPAEIATAKAMYYSLKALMDDRGWEIFELWLSGKTGNEVVFDNEQWKEYMSADKRLEHRISAEFEKNAESV